MRMQILSSQENFNGLSTTYILKNQNNYIKVLRDLYGPYSFEALQAINVCSNNFSEFARQVTEYLNQIKLASNEDGQDFLIHKLLFFFVEQKGLNGQELIQFIDEALNNGEKESSIVENYGMSKMYPKQLTYYLNKILCLNLAFSQQTRYNKWKCIKRRVLQMANHLVKKANFLAAKYIIKDPEEFKQALKIQKIPILQQEQSIDKLFEIVEVLGLDHLHVKQVIQKITYPGYLSRLQNICMSIIPGQLQKNIKHDLQALFENIKGEQFYSRNFVSIIASYFEHQGQIKLLSIERKVDIDENIKIVLKSMTNNHESVEMVNQIILLVTKLAQQIVEDIRQNSMFIKSYDTTGQDRLDYQASKKGPEKEVLLQTSLKRAQSDSFVQRDRSQHTFSQQDKNLLLNIKESLVRLPSIVRESLSDQTQVRNLIQALKSFTIGNIVKTNSLTNRIEAEVPQYLSKKTSRSSVASEKSLSHEESVIFNKKSIVRQNMFILPNEKILKVTKNIRVLLIYYSNNDYYSMELKKIKLEDQKSIKKDKSTEKKFDRKHESKKYKGAYIHYVTFEIPQLTDSYMVETHRSALKILDQKTSIKIEVDQAKIENGHYLQLEINASLRQKLRQNIRQVINFSFINGVGVIMHFLMENKYPSEAIYNYFAFFNSEFSPFDNAKILSQMVKQIDFSKTNPNIHSRYLIYFIFSLFRNNSLNLYLKSELFKKLEFDKKQIFTPPPQKYSHLIILEEFYKLTQLIDLLLYHPKQVGWIINFVCLSLKNNRPESNYIVLSMVSARGSFEIVEALDGQFRRQLNQNLFLSAFQYFSIRVVFVTKKINQDEEKYEYNKQLVLTFIEQTIKLYKQQNRIKTVNSIQQIERSEIQGLFLPSPRMYIMKDWIHLVKNIKKLREVSNNEIDLIPFINKNNYYFEDRNLTVDYLRILLREQTTDFDHQQSERIFVKTNIAQQQVQQLILAILKDGIKVYSLSLFKHLFIKKYLYVKEIKAEQVDSMLFKLDEFAMKCFQKDELSFADFIFKKYLEEALIEPKGDKLSLRSENMERYKKYLREIKRLTFRVFTLKRILSLAKQRQQVINMKDLFFELFPSNSVECRAQRKELQRIYNENFVLKIEASDRNSINSVIRPVSCNYSRPRR